MAWSIQGFLKLSWVHGLLILLLSFLIYGQSLHYGYVLDDTIVVDENKFVAKGVNGIWDILSKETFTGYFGEQKNLVAGARYRPLSLVSFAIEHSIFGKKPGISHFINILLYALCGLFFYRLIINLKIIADKNAGIYLALIASLLFIAHPIHSEAVANIKGRDEIMCLLFSLIALFQFIQYYDSKQLSNIWIASISFFLALLSKENAITYLAIVPLTLVVFRNVTLFSAIRKTWPLLVVALIFLIIRTEVIGYFFNSGVKITDLMNDPFIGMKSSEKFATIIFTIGWYIKLLMFPHPLTHDYYPYHVQKMGLTSMPFLISIILILAIIILAYKKRKSQPLFFYCVSYFIITISIVSNFIFPVGTFMNERFLFMPSIGFILLISHYGYQSIMNQNRLYQYSSMLLFSLLFIGYTFKTVTRVPDWKDGFSLNISGANISQNSARINMFAGVSYFQLYQNEKDQTKKYEYLTIADQYMDKSLKIFPDYGQGLNMKAGILAEWHKKDNNTEAFLKGIIPVVERRPDLTFVNEYLAYLNKNPSNASVLLPFYRQIGYDVLYKKKRRYDFAIQYLTSAKELNPNNPEILKQLSEIYTTYAGSAGVSAKDASDYRTMAQNLLNQINLIPK
jgi:tetratricopeptide (TPR) repeat protein